MPRPKLTEPRDRQVNVALTAREFDSLKAAAEAAGMRFADYARQLLLRRWPLAETAVETVEVSAETAVEAQRVRTPAIDRLAYGQLARIGANLNQAVRQMHSFGLPGPPDLEPLLRDIRGLVDRWVNGHGS